MWLSQNMRHQREVMELPQVNVIKAKIVERGESISTIASAIGLNRATLYRKLRDPDRFSVSEVKKLAKVLRLSAEEAEKIFFS